MQKILFALLLGASAPAIGFAGEAFAADQPQSETDSGAAPQAGQADAPPDAAPAPEALAPGAGPSEPGTGKPPPAPPEFESGPDEGYMPRDEE